MDLLHETTHQTALGQFLDLTTSEPNKVDFSRFSLSVYSDIVIYKTAFYSFYLPWYAEHATSGHTAFTTVTDTAAAVADIGAIAAVAAVAAAIAAVAAVAAIAAIAAVGAVGTVAARPGPRGKSQPRHSPRLFLLCGSLASVFAPLTPRSPRRSLRTRAARLACDWRA